MSTSPHAPQVVAATTNPFPPDESALPRAPVLSYLVNISTPTRVRKIAATGVVLVALGSFGLILTVLGFTAWQIHELATWRTWHGSPSWTDYVDAAKNLDDWRFMRVSSSLSILLNVKVFWRTILIAVLLAPALGLLVFSRAIFLGRSVPSRMSFALVLPFTLAMFPAFAIPACAGLVNGLGRGAERAQLLWLFVAPPGVFVILILKDLCAYLLWIARNPMLDKPPVPFLATQKG